MTVDAPEEYKFEGSFDNLNHLLELFSYKANQVTNTSSSFVVIFAKFYV